MGAGRRTAFRTAAARAICSVAAGTGSSTGTIAAFIRLSDSGRSLTAVNGPERQEINMSTKAHKGGSHHEIAAEHHETAAHHHREAAKHYESGDHEKAGHHAHVAHAHDCMRPITGTRPQNTTPSTITKRGERAARCGRVIPVGLDPTRPLRRRGCALALGRPPVRAAGSSTLLRDPMGHMPVTQGGFPVP